MQRHTLGVCAGIKRMFAVLGGGGNLKGSLYYRSHVVHVSLLDTSDISQDHGQIY